MINMGNQVVNSSNFRWLGATQMESTHARKTFPCFDEPQYKATFTIIIERTPEYKTVLANTKLASTEQL